jgi:hypothetical protein
MAAERVTGGLQAAFGGGRSRGSEAQPVRACLRAAAASEKSRIRGQITTRPRDDFRPLKAPEVVEWLSWGLLTVSQRPEHR